MPSLIAADGQIFEVPEAGCLIGRGDAEPGEPLLLDLSTLPGGRTVSRRHARLRPVDDTWHLQVDMEALNPVWVDEAQAPWNTDVVLRNRAQIRLGDVFVTFQLSPGAPAEGPVPALGTQSTVDALERPELKRVTPFRGMMVDELLWDDAHSYHRLQARIHQLSGHGFGIIEGLSVRSDPMSPGALLVAPGIAVDALGRVLLVPEVQRLQGTSFVPATSYVTLRWHEQPADPQQEWTAAQQHTRMIEGFRITVDVEPPVAPALELARITGGGTLRNATDLFAPQPGDIDLRFRPLPAARTRHELGIAQLVVGALPGDAVAQRHQKGLQYLLREVNSTHPYRVHWAGAVPMGNPLPPAALVYLTGNGGFSVPEGGLDMLRAFLAEGGVLLADACADGQPAEFAASVLALAGQLGRNPGLVLRNHQLLTVRHVFGIPPTTLSGEPALTEHDGFVASAGDFGCTWQGGSDTAPREREAIRSALELGVNLAVYGALRREPLQALEL